MARPKKTKLEDLKQTNGQLETAENIAQGQRKFQPTTLDQIWGDTGMSKYGTLEITQYESYLDNLNKSDLYAHASKIGIMPIDSRERLKKNLLKEFQLYAGNYKKPIDKLPNQLKEVPENVLKVLAEGR